MKFLNLVNPLALVAVLAMVGVAQAQVTRKGEGYLFRVKFRVGHPVNLAIDAKMAKNAQLPSGIAFTMHFTLTPLSVSPHFAHLHMSMPAVKVNGQPMGEGQQADLDIDDRGRPSGLQVATGPIGMSYPEKALKVGDSFNGKVPLGGAALGAMAATGQTPARYTFRGFKGSGASRFAIFDVKIVAQTATAKGRILVDPNDGLPHSANIGLSIKAGNTPMKVDMTIRRG